MPRERAIWRDVVAVARDIEAAGAVVTDILLEVSEFNATCRSAKRSSGVAALSYLPAPERSILIWKGLDAVPAG